MKNNSLLSVLIALFLSVSLLLPAVGVQAQDNTPVNEELLALIEGMTPEERVGQLFLVSFDGASVADESQIAALLDEYFIGGIMLRADRGNFAFEEVGDLQQLGIDLQRRYWDASRLERLDPVSGELFQPKYIPLWLGLALDEETGAPGNALSALSPVPSPMAIAATWQPDLAASVGENLGSELAALGVNLYLGPSLDIISDPEPTNSGDMGTVSFGGDPYWVSQMGSAFIRGLRSGSDGKLLVVASHFPGRGSADRAPTEEMATVRTSLTELQTQTLAPFSAAVLEGTDGLLLSHIRYEGFQGTIRATTRPLSLDEKSLSQLLSNAPFADWRTEGGLLISDDLGTPAIRNFYAPGNEDFYANLIARDAFLAGSDLLYMGNIVSSDAPDNYTSITRTLDFFAQKYREDPAFAERVDAALLRILAKKEQLYPNFSLFAVAHPQGLAEIGSRQQAAFDVAQRSATLINPDLGGLDAILPAPPAVDDQILFLTDTQPISTCPLCGSASGLERTTLRDAVLRLYGSSGAQQVRDGNLSTYTFDDLPSLYVETEEFSMLDSLQAAEWVVISLASNQQTDALRQFLNDFQPLLREKKVILYSFTTPYLLDATDISKFTAYYGLYSYAPPFLDVAARLLFKELTPEGASPVDISGIGYELNTALQPDAEQYLTLGLALPLESPPTPAADSATLAPTMIPMFAVGDTLGVRTGTIYDYNGNPVPDGTLVTFTLTMGGEMGREQRIEAQTVSGIARADFQLNETGLLDIRVSAGNATVSETLRLDISDVGIAAAVTIIPPALPQQATVTPRALTPTPTAVPSSYVYAGKLGMGMWGVSLILWLFGALIAFMAGERIESQRWGVRWALTTMLGGLAAYNYLALGLPGSTIATADGLSSVIIFIVLAELLGWLAGWLWLRRTLE